MTATAKHQSSHYCIPSLSADVQTDGMWGKTCYWLHTRSARCHVLRSSRVFRPCKNDWNKQVFTQDSNHISIWTPQIFVRIPVFPLCVELESWEKMAHCGNTKALTALFTYLFSTELRSRTVSKPPPVWKHYGNKIKQLKGISLQMTGSAHASASCWWNWFNPTVA